MTAVHPLFGNVAVPDQPVADVVERLENLLEEARSGQLVAIAYAGVRRRTGDDHEAGSGWASAANMNHRLLAAASILHVRLAHSLAGLDEE